MQEGLKPALAVPSALPRGSPSSDRPSKKRSSTETWPASLTLRCDRNTEEDKHDMFSCHYDFCCKYTCIFLHYLSYISQKRYVTITPKLS